MRTRGMALAIAVSIVSVAQTACFSSARYDTAHVRRVADINARYDAESRRLAASLATRIAALDELRAALVPLRPSSRAPLHRLDERDDQLLLRAIDDESAAIAHLHDQALGRLQRARQDEIRASTRRRDAEVAAGRAARRARVKAAASAYPARDRAVHDTCALRTPAAPPAPDRERCPDDPACTSAPTAQ